MPLIEGVGDEVTQFAMAVLCGVVLILAWWSTGYRQERFRTVFIMERNVRRLYRLMPRRIIGRTQQNDVTIIQWSGDTAPQTDTEDFNEEEFAAIENHESSDVTEEPVSTEETPEAIEENPAESSSSSQVTTQQDSEMNKIVDAMDSDSNCTLRNRRLAFFQNSSSGNSDITPESNSDMQQSPTIAESPNDPDKSDSSDEKNSDDNNSSDSEKKDQNTDNIRIRLKYLNDDQKMVEGSLQEPLGEFKRRHFRGELSARKLVRLIFNGQVLQREGATLASCGLFDNCVVHCLIHQPRTPSQFAQAQQQLNPVNPNLNNNIHNANITPHIRDPQSTEGSQHEERDWDLSHILLTILASILSIAWYCHIRFSSLFGVAASIAMLGLTALYFIAVICVYYPESQPTHTVNPPSPVATETPQTNNAE